MMTGKRTRSIRWVILSAILTSITAGQAFAALPFITDDADTLGKGTSQVELLYGWSNDKETADGSSAETTKNLPAATFGYGVAERLDLTLGFAREWGKSKAGGASSNDVGNALFALSAKWKFHEDEISGFHFALKPLAAYSYLVGGTGDDHTVSLGGWAIATKEFEPFSVSLNMGYLHNDYGSAGDRDAYRSSIWIVSALATYEVIGGLKLGCDIGASTNRDKADSTIPAFVEAGAIYSLNKNVDLGLGLKFAVTKPEPDFAGFAGVTVKF